MRAWSRHALVTELKRVAFARRGEPYQIGGRTLRFTPGARPVKLRYANSPNAVNRYDALQLKLLSEAMREGDVGFDVGSHAGTVALVMAAVSGPTGQVVAFEPDPDARRAMARNFDLNPQVKRPQVVSAAVSDVSGQSRFFSDHGQCNSSLVSSATGVADPEELLVETIDLDGYVERTGLRPDWIKIDIEGAEIRALRGAVRLLAGPAHILCELHPYAWPAFGDSFDDLLQILATSGRAIRYLDETGPHVGEPFYGIVALDRL